MRSVLTIGAFSRATQMSLKTLRYYHRIGLLEPASVDAATGYRHYAAHQIPTAQVIRRFRAVGMPVEEVRTMLAADVPTRTSQLAVHLERLEGELAKTASSIAVLRELMVPSSLVGPIEIVRRTVAPVHAIAIRTAVALEELGAWFRAASDELRATLATQGLSASGPKGALVAEELFTDERGEVTLYLPCPAAVRVAGRVASMTVPGAELAMVTHRGSHDDIDRSYGALGAHVAQSELRVDGLVREHYLVGADETADPTAWVTEIGWPIFQTR